MPCTLFHIIRNTTDCSAATDKGICILWPLHLSADPQTPPKTVQDGILRRLALFFPTAPRGVIPPNDNCKYYFAANSFAHPQDGATDEQLGAVGGAWVL